LLLLLLLLLLALLLALLDPLQGRESA